MAGLDDEIRALAQAILARPSPDLAHLGAERITYAVDRCLLRLERLRLDERADWVAAELLAAEGRGERETVTRLARPPTPDQRIPAGRRSPDRTGNRARAGMTGCPLNSSRPATITGGTPWLIPWTSSSSKPF